MNRKRLPLELIGAFSIRKQETVIKPEKQFAVFKCPCVTILL
jgi:hypothetical protein